MKVLYSQRKNLWKIADVGLKIDDPSVRMITTDLIRQGGSYWAPELQRRRSQYAANTDIWSLGCILFEMTTGRKRFASDLNVREYAKLPTAYTVIPSSAECVDAEKRNSLRSIDSIINSMLKVNPSDRPSATGLVDVLQARIRQNRHRTTKLIPTTVWNIFNVLRPVVNRRMSDY